MNVNEKVIFLLRASIAFTLFYAAVSGFFDPNSWIGFIPFFATKILPAKTILIIFEVIQILVALALLFMKNPFYPAILSALLVSGIIVFNIPQFSILFRDVPIVVMSIALALYYKRAGSQSLSQNNEQNYERK